VFAQTTASPPDLTSELLQGCLKTPSPNTVAKLASDVGATPYSEQRRQSELKTSTISYEEPATGNKDQTKTTVTEFRGWDLIGHGGGIVVYQELKVELAVVDGSTQQPVKPARTTLDRACSVQARVTNARAVLQLYEDLTERPYGIRISTDGRWVNVFTFDEGKSDVEINLGLDAPLAGVTLDGKQVARLVVPDGGPRFIDHDALLVPPGIPTVVLLKAALLEALDHPAIIIFNHIEIQPAQPPAPPQDGPLGQASPGQGVRPEG
jgi:hypothetical protein